jgi:hypothetical protein
MRFGAPHLNLSHKTLDLIRCLAEFLQNGLRLRLVLLAATCLPADVISQRSVYT